MSQSPSLTAFVVSQKGGTLGALPDSVRYLLAALVRGYIYEGIPVHTVPYWSWKALDRSISKIPHASGCTPGMTVFIRGDMRKHVRVEFIILLPATDAVRVFGEDLNMSFINAIP